MAEQFGQPAASQRSWDLWPKDVPFQMQPVSPIYYEVHFENAIRHLVDVAIWIPIAGHDESAGKCQLVFPVWTPGSYMVREYSRNVEKLDASIHDCWHGESRGEACVQRIGKNVWSFDSEDAAWLRVRYQLYCREMSVRTNWVELDFGFLTGAATFPYVDGQRDQPIEVRLSLPATWREIATSLCRLQPDAAVARFQAENYDQLVDSPIAMGDFPVRSFCVGGVPHYLAHIGDNGQWDLDRAVADVERIVAQEQEFWGDIPYEDYWFINLVMESGGGLEHDNSTVLMTSRWAMGKRDSYLNWLALVSHEFFHTWNVRRLRPKALMEYDYTQEQYVRELWIAEGITSYFDDLMLVWADLCTREEYLVRLSKNIQTVQAAPGRLVQPLEQSSWDAWTKHYRPDENSQNSRISYYLKGAIVAWLLDTRLRIATDGVQHLAGVMQRLWRDFRHTGYTLEDFERTVELCSGTEIREWLHEQIRYASELDYSSCLQYLGLRFKSNPVKREATGDKGTSDVWIGSESANADGRLYVRKVFRGSPSDDAGLNVDDELVALDGMRITPESWPDRLAMYAPGQKLELLVSRRGRMRTLSICLGQKSSNSWQLETDPAATAVALQNLQSWLTFPRPLRRLASA